MIDRSADFESDRLSSEHDKLLNYLGDYSDKLKSSSRMHYERRTKANLIGFVGFVSGILTTFGLVYLYSIRNSDFIGKLSDFNAIAVLLLTTILLFSLLITLIGLKSIWDTDRVTQFEIIPLQQALRRLLIRASKLERHSVQDGDMRIIFDLRLAEAESALALSDWVLKTQTGIIPFSMRRMKTMSKY